MDFGRTNFVLFVLNRALTVNVSLMSPWNCVYSKLSQDELSEESFCSVG